MRLRLFALCLLLLLTCSCTSKYAKSVSTQVKANEAIHRDLDKAIYQNLQEFVKHDLEQMLEAKEQRLEAIRQKYRALILGQLDNEFSDALTAEFIKIDEGTEQRIEKAVNADQKRMEVGRGAVAKVRIYEASNKHRQELQARLLNRLEAEVKAAGEELQKVRTDAEKVQAKVQAALDIVQKHYDEIMKGNEQLDKYLHRKSEITLFSTSLLESLGIKVDADKVEEKVSGFSEAIEQRADSIVDRLNGRLESILSKSNSAT